MRKEDIKIGMSVVYKSKIFPIKDIINDKAIITGKFPEAILEYPTTIEIPLQDLLENSGWSSFCLKEAIQFDETILVSNDQKTWFIRSFYGYSYPGILTRLSSVDNDPALFDSLGETTSEYVRWKYYKRIQIKE